MCLTLGVTILASTAEIQHVLSYQCTVGTPVWNSKSSMHLRITLVFFTAFYIYLIYPSVESDAIGWLNLYFPENINTNQSMYNTRN